MIGSVITIVIWGAVLYAIVNSVRKKNTGGKSGKSNVKSTANVNAKVPLIKDARKEWDVTKGPKTPSPVGNVSSLQRAATTHQGPVNAGHDHTSASESSGAHNVYAGGASSSTHRAEAATHTLMEDRQNDWMARELREEKRALYRVNDIFDYQMEHRTHYE